MGYRITLIIGRRQRRDRNLRVVAVPLLSSIEYWVQKVVGCGAMVGVSAQSVALSPRGGDQQARRWLTLRANGDGNAAFISGDRSSEESMRHTASPSCFKVHFDLRAKPWPGRPVDRIHGDRTVLAIERAQVRMCRAW
jgi:hypothetical protein